MCGIKGKILEEDELGFPPSVSSLRGKIQMEASWARSQASSSPGENLGIDALDRSYPDLKVLKGEPWRHSRAHLEQRTMGLK